MKVTIKNLTKRFPDMTAVNDFSAVIESGELIALLGPSGCGKSTMLNMISGILPSTEGKIYFDDKDVTDLTPEKRGVGLVFQNYALYPHMTVYENMAFGLKLRKVPKEIIDQKVKAAAEILGITDYLSRKPKALSGGQRQRVALGRTIVREPKVFLLDEPLSNLDAKLRESMRFEILSIQKKLNITVVYVTHDQIEAMTVADRIAVMNKGKVQQIDTPDTIYHHPANVFVATFIGSPAMNVVKARIEGTKIVIGECAIEIPAEWLKIVGTRKEVIFGLRPEAAKPNFDNAMVKGTVDFMENTGNLKTASLTLADGQNFFIQDSNQNIDLRNVTGFDFDWTNVNLFDVETEENIGYVEA